ncbi:LysR family transcriptional regulator [Ruegeria arenilitoris]|uniref:LysR family transcriptional regulator n=1 Tax=Ruegeria arenilitoris TaxID=1173585 RepID=UPI00147AB1B8|nr:LysR family transcriptional regulator [Ruegeria arenilitoris]
MQKTNFLDLDGHILRTFLAILENSSVSVAAEQLGVTQPAVSHTLGRLRNILGDPLFVRSGQGLMPTETALALKEPVQRAIDGLKCLTDDRIFDPRAEKMEFVVAANDMQRDLVFPQLIREAWNDGISVDFQFLPSGQPTVNMMREARCELALTPLPPDGPDIFQKPLFSGEMMCFYDAEMRDPPKSWKEYCSADHLTVRFAGGGTSIKVITDLEASQIGEPRVSVPNFNAIPPFIKGTRMIATEVSLMRLHTLRELDVAPLPFKSNRVTIYMIWHERSTNDPAHIWLRNRISEIASMIPELMQDL